MTILPFEMKLYKSVLLCFAVAILMFDQQVEAVTVIDATTNNGGLLTGTTLADNGLKIAANGTTFTNPAPSSLTLATNDNGRALVTGSGAGQFVHIDGWQTTRISYPGGNGAQGFDGSNAVGSEPFQYAFVNSGVVDLDSDVIAGSFSAGDVFDLSYWIEQTTSTTASSATATLSFDGGSETHTFVALAGPGSTNAVQFSDNYTLLADATSVQVNIRMDTGGNIGNQFKLDSIELNQTIPEPSGFCLATFCLAGLCCARWRRR